MSWTAFKMLLGMKIELAEYPMIEKQFVLFANSRMSPCPRRSLLCRSSKRILCVSSCTFLNIDTALNTGPWGRWPGWPHVRTCTCISSFNLHNSLIHNSRFLSILLATAKRDFLQHYRLLLLNHDRLNSSAYCVPLEVWLLCYRFENGLC